MGRGRRNPASEFGVEIVMYCARNGISQKELSEKAGVSYYTMRDAMRGKRPAHELVQQVRRVMNA